jgi:hypothetical protein
MTYDHTDFDHTPPAPWQELDALLDGEPVNREALRRALADDDAREYLVEALLLRRMARAMGPARFVTAGAASTPPGRFLRRVAAGAIVALSLGAGYA